MTTLIKSVLILDSTSSFYKKKVDLRIQDGVLQEIAENINHETNQEIIEGKELVFIPGIYDLRVHNTLPGGEHRESWETLVSAAKAGGVQGIQLLPTGNPAPQTAEQIQFISKLSTVHGIDLIPMAPLTLDNKGENFTDLIDLFHAGARGFSHAGGSLQNTDLFLKCLQYLITQPVTIFTQADSGSLSLFGQINEGIQSTLTGLKGIPELSETLAIKRDIDLLTYVLHNSFGNEHKEFALHFYCISSKESLRLIQEAKEKGLPITCSVAAHQLIFDENIVESFDTNTKVFPPYRTKEDKEALCQGILDGSIDVIVSDHHPVEVELKDIEFDHASFGVIGLQTILQASFESFKSKDYSKVVKALVDNPKKILKVTQDVLKVNGKVFGTILDTKDSSKFTIEQIKSNSKNSAFLDYQFKSKIIKTFSA